MSQNEMISKVEQLREWEALLEEAQTEIEALRDSIKAEMLEKGTEELQVGTYIIRWTSVLSNRFDSTAFKKEYADLYKSYTKQVASKRFSIA
jgi:predicted phage-related endonuclease